MLPHPQTIFMNSELASSTQSNFVTCLFVCLSWSSHHDLLSQIVFLFASSYLPYHISSVFVLCLLVKFFFVIVTLIVISLLAGRLLPRLLPPTLGFLALATWLLQTPPGPVLISSRLQQPGGKQPEVGKLFGAPDHQEQKISVISNPKQRQLHLAVGGEPAVVTDSQWVNQTLITSYKNKTSIYLYSAYLVRFGHFIIGH